MRYTTMQIESTDSKNLTYKNSIFSTHIFLCNIGCTREDDKLNERCRLWPSAVFAAPLILLLCIAILKTLDLKPRVTVFAMALSTFQIRTQLRCFTVDIGQGVVPTPYHQ